MTTVIEAMHPGVQWMEPDTPLQTLAKTMRDEDNGVIATGDNDRLIGMVTDRDIVCRGVATGDEHKRLAGMLSLGDICAASSNETAGAVLTSLAAHHA